MKMANPIIDAEFKQDLIDHVITMLKTIEFTKHQIEEVEFTCEVILKSIYYNEELKKQNENLK